MKSTLVLLAALALAGCQACREHPTACAAGVILAVGVIDACANHGTNATSRAIFVPTSPCTVQPNGSCR